MSPPTMSLAGEGAIAKPAAEVPEYKNPFLWVPSSYLTMGLIYITVGAVANIMFSRMGMPNDQAALWSSILGFPYTFKFLWAPALELYKTKKFFVVLMQFCIAASLAGVGFALRLPGTSWIPPVLGSVRHHRPARGHAGHRHRRRVRHHAAAQGTGEVPRIPEHVLERRGASREGAVRDHQRLAPRQHRKLADWPG